MNSLHVYAFLKHIAILFPTFVTIFTVRGFFQASAAYFVGDTTPRDEGFLTLNPLAHVDVFGTLCLSFLVASAHSVAARGGPSITMLLLALMVFLGIKPHYFVPIMASEFTHRRWGIFVTTLASTLSHLFVVLASMYTLLLSFDWLGGASPAFLIIQQVTSSMTEWALFWAVLSLIPIPPFEGGSLLPVFFGDVGQAVYDFLEPYGLFILLALLWLPGARELMLAGVNALHFLLYNGLMQLVFI